MADNTQVAGGTGDTIRDKDRAGVKTQIVGLDLGIGTGTENLMTGVMPIRGADQTAVTGTITTATSTVGGATDYSTVGNITVTIDGTYAGVNMTFEVSGDGGTTWYATQGQRIDNGIAQSATGALTANTATAWNFSMLGYNRFRVRATAWTSGTANIDILPGTMPFVPVVSAMSQSIASPTSTVTNVAASATSVTLIAANTNRKALYIFNAGTANLFVRLGAVAATTTTGFTDMIPPNGFWELPDDPIYTGEVRGIWSATGGSGANLTELS